MRSCWVLGILLTWVTAWLPGVGAADVTAPADSDLLTSAATGIAYRHGISYLREPSYPPGFTHFRFVDPNAPKGGRLRVGQMGSWDNFNGVA
ncbi:MAG: hypothetical protein ACNA7W_05655, partial [Pseudomonadales bacterium]